MWIREDSDKKYYGEKKATKKQRLKNKDKERKYELKLREADNGTDMKVKGKMTKKADYDMKGRKKKKKKKNSSLLLQLLKQNKNWRKFFKIPSWKEYRFLLFILFFYY